MKYKQNIIRSGFLTKAQKDSILKSSLLKTKKHGVIENFENKIRFELLRCGKYIKENKELFLEKILNTFKRGLKFSDKNKYAYILLSGLACDLYSEIYTKNTKSDKALLSKLLKEILYSLVFKAKIFDIQQQKVIFGNGKRIKTPNFLILKASGAKARELTFALSDLPIEVEPKNWNQYGKKGGYLFSNYDMVEKNIATEFSCVYNKSLIEEINVMQKTKLYFDYEKIIEGISNKNLPKQLSSHDAHIINDNYIKLNNFLVELRHKENEIIKKYEEKIKKLSKSMDECKNIKFKIKKEQNIGKYQKLITQIRENFKIKKYLSEKKNEKIYRLLAEENVSTISDIKNKLYILYKFLYPYLMEKNRTGFYLPIFLDKRNRMYNKGVISHIGFKYIRKIITLQPECNSECVEYDAKTSMFQMIGLYLKDEKMLRLCGCYGEDEQMDIYKLISKRCLESLKEENKFLRDFLSERALIKGVVMKYIYGALKSTIKSDITQTIVGISQRDRDIVYESIIQSIIYNFPKLIELIEILNKIGVQIANSEEPIIQYENKDYRASLKYLKVKADRLDLRFKLDQKQQKRIQISYMRVTENINKMKYSRSILPNICHMLDSYIARQTIIGLNNKGIKCLCIHDSFIIHEEYEAELKSEYVKALANNSEISIYDVLQKSLKSADNNREIEKLFEELRIFCSKVNKKKLNKELIKKSTTCLKKD